MKILQKARTADATTSCRLQPRLGCAVGRAEGHHVRNCLLCVCEEQQGADRPPQTRPEALILPVVVVFLGLLANRSGLLTLLTLAIEGSAVGALGRSDFAVLVCFLREFFVVPLANLYQAIPVSRCYCHQCLARRFLPPLRGRPDQQDRS